MGKSPNVSTTLLKVRVQVGAKSSRVHIDERGIWHVSVPQRALRNRANTKVRGLIAEHLNLPLAAVWIVKGQHSPSKLLQVVKRNSHAY